jgi:hypothetical protein
MAQDHDDPSGRARWFLKRRIGPEGSHAPEQILKASQARHQQLWEQAARSRIAFLPPGDGAVNWTPIGPSAVRHGSPAGNPVVSGRITGLAAGPGGRVYAGAANGGAWFSGDLGKSWEPLDEWFAKAPLPPTDKDADSLAVGAIAVKFGAQRENDVLFVGTGEPVGGDVAYFGVGIKVSNDGGTSFPADPEATNLAGQAVDEIVIDPDGSGDPFALAATTAGLYARPAGSDRTNWVKKNPSDVAADGATSVIVAGRGSSKTYYAAFKTSKTTKVYSSTDGGTTWLPVGGIGAPEGRIALAASETTPSVVYALAHDGSTPKLFRRDGSNDFRVINFQPSNPDVQKLFGEQGNYDIVVAVDPSSSDTVYLAGSGITTQGSFNLTLFGGVVDSSANTLTATYIGLGVHADAHCLAFETKTDGTHKGDVIWVGTDGGPFCSTQTGAPGSFAPRNNGLAVTQLTSLDHRLDTDAVVIAGCQDNGTIRYWGEPAWYHCGPGDGGGVAIDPNDPRRVMRQGTAAHLMTCTDGALTDDVLTNGVGSWLSLWSENFFPPTSDETAKKAESGNTQFYTRIRAFDAGAGASIAAFGTNRLWVTSDWGRNWKTLPSYTNPLAASPADLDKDKLIGSGVVDIRFATSTLIYVATETFVYRFEQTGGAWGPNPPDPMNIVGLPFGPPLSSIAVANAGTGSIYLGYGGSGAHDRVWYFDGSGWHGTRPGGGTGIPNVPVNALVVDPANERIVYASTDVGVWQGTKAQSENTWTWKIFSSGLPESAVLDLAIHPKARLLRAATHGRGAWEISLDAASGHDTDVYLRAHTADNGRRFPWAENVPDPTMPGRYATRALSPDIRIWRSSKSSPPAALDFVGFADLDLNASALDPTGANRIFVQVHNRGKDTAASAGVTVYVVLASADNGVPALPADFATRIRNKDTSAWPGWKFADVAYKTLGANLAAEASQVVSFDVDLSTWPLTKGPVCAVALVSAANDPIEGTDTNVDTALASNKYIAAKMMQVAASPGFWRPGGTMVNPRFQHNATLLHSGGVFVAGGFGFSDPVQGAEISNAFANAWSSSAIPGRCKATTLLDGRVLLVLSGIANYFWDPATRAMTQAPNRQIAMGYAASTLTRLNDGTVLMICPDGTELFDPVANSWTVLALTGGPATIHTATRLGDGRIVVQGYSQQANQAVTIVQVFDPKTRPMNWTSAAANTPLGAVYDNSATCLPDGTVLFIGGARYDNKGAVNTVITLDPNPTNPTWRQMTPMPQPLMEHTATLLDDGTVLVVGGRHDWQFNCLATVSRYDFKSWHQEPNMTWPRAKHTATNLPTGEVMIAGGYSSNQNDTPKDCEIYVPTVK